MRAADRFLPDDFLADVDIGMHALGDTHDAGNDGVAVAAVKIDAAHPLGARRLRQKRCSRPASPMFPQFSKYSHVIAVVMPAATTCGLQHSLPGALTKSHSGCRCLPLDYVCMYAS